MIKRPIPNIANIKLAAALRGDDISKAIDPAWEDYKFQITVNLIMEYGISDPYELLVVIAEKFHPELKIKHKRGAIEKWTDFLCELLASEIQKRRDSGDPLKIAIRDLCNDPLWGKFTGDRDGTHIFNKYYKKGKSSKNFQITKQMYDRFPEEVETLVKKELKKFQSR
jgi:hypothetical protein